MPDCKTITAPAEAEFTIQRSRFITHTFPVTSEAEAAAAIRAMKKKYFDARHNCSAWRIGADGALQRSSDDGEPGGTAGAPILEAITRNGLTDILIVVTRYFGGIKLGAGGLTRAYSHAAMLGINASPVAINTLFHCWAVTVSYPLLGTVENFIRQQGLRTGEGEYAENVTLHLLLRPAEEDSVLAALTELTAAGHTAEKTGETIIPLPWPPGES